MRSSKDNTTDRHGTTIVELTVAVAILSTVFAVLMPLFAGIRNSTDARWAGLEMVQNARVLNEHLCRHLAQARRVRAVSAGTEDRGWCELEAGDGVVYRYAVRDDDWIEFGPVDDLTERGNPTREPSHLGILAGPVEYRRFVCYNGEDLSNPTRDTDSIHLVTWEAGLRSIGRLTQGRAVMGACCLRLRPPVESSSGGRNAP